MTKNYRALFLALALAPFALIGCDDGEGGDDGGTDGSMADSGPGDAGPPAETCSDGITNQDETDEDCGGVCGATCTPGEMCGDNGDCTTDNCDSGTCQPAPNCMDGVLNGTETDVDCGGTMCNGCDNGDMCTVDDDCTSEFCSGGACADPVCGNGMVEGPEDCDDGMGGTPAETATCDLDCSMVMCGDGVANGTAGEECDGDGMGMGGETATCDTDCTAARCGDGIANTTAGEACDGDGMGMGGETATCDTDCTANMCGDGLVNRAAGEQCDDGNMIDADLCSNTCMINAPAVNITADGTLNTETGELDGTVLMGWDGATSTLFASDFTLAAGATLTFTGANPFRVEAGGNVQIDGVIDASGADGNPGICNGAGGLGGAGGPGGGAGGDGGRVDVTPPATLDGAPGMGTGAGGGGLSDEAGGGGAGHLTVGQPGVNDQAAATPGAGGAAYSALVTLEGGSGGGGGSADDDGAIGVLEAGDDGGGGGGGGGGSVSFSSTGTITVTGTIDASGGDGGDGNCTPNSASGGGGSGGTVVLISSMAAPDVTMATISVAGGAGGTFGPVGGDASDGETYIGLPPSCGDAAQNQDESDVDCGGSICAACADGLSCRVDGDCAGMTCVAGTCVPGTCRDMVMNGMETDVDCGGPSCTPCADGLMCTVDTDCAGSGCEMGACVSCADGVMNDEETAVDCGGTECGGCADGVACLVDGDCAGTGCEANLCVSCTDGVQNDEETDLDCGGTECGGCILGQMCTVSGDCLGTCTAGMCGTFGETCADQITLTSGTQTVRWSAAVNDFSMTPSCLPGFAMPDGPDVVMSYTATLTGDLTYTITKPINERWVVVVSSGACGAVTPEVSCNSEFGPPALTGTFAATMGTTYFFYLVDSNSGAMPLTNPFDLDITETPFPPCRNMMRDGMETDVDCGGPTCGGCAPTQMCVVDTDCAIGTCTGGTCSTGTLIDDFETGATLNARWMTSGDVVWSVSTTLPIAGTQSAQAGTVLDSQQSNLDLAVTCTGATAGVQFDYRTDSEAGFDFLNFQIDGMPAPGVSTWSGMDSGTETFIVPAGMHTLRWQYIKDGVVAAGADTAWIDNVRLFGCTAP